MTQKRSEFQNIIRLILLAFVCLGFFTLGTFVGRNIEPALNNEDLSLAPPSHTKINDLRSEKVETNSSDSNISQIKKKDQLKTSFLRYTIQVASYRKELEASKLSLALQKKGYTAFYAPGKLKNKNLYRVHVGLFTKKSSAQRFIQSFLKKENYPLASVRKITN